uniref:Protein TIFY n=1 Tax=Salix viminalis TaxID=40686 RepID=A0A6N2KB79_SALVM
MERDFLGLGTIINPVTIKEATSDTPNKDSVAMRGSGMQWSFSNKVSAIPQFLSFKSSLEEKPRKAVHDPLASSSGFMSISTADAFDSSQKTYSGLVQKNHYPMTNYGTQQCDAYAVNRPQDMRMFSISGQQNQAITVSMSSPTLQSHFPPTGNNMLTNSIVSKPLGGVPVITPPSALPSSIIGTTDLRDGAKSSGAPAQLTIFYAGSVCVYNDVSPEKAQAIMFLAGNGGTSGTQNQPISTPQAQAQIRRPHVGDIFVGNKINTSAPISCIPSPISVTSSNTNDSATVKPVVSLASSVKQTNTSKPVNSPGPTSATLVPAVAVPQARKASLARFLEKRKERVMQTSPYNVSKKSPDIDPHGCDGASLSMNFSSSFPLPTSN